VHRPAGVVAVALVLALAAAGCARGSAGRAEVPRGPVTSPADIARTIDDAVFTIDCRFSHRAMDDPIVKPGKPGASHSHDFFGNASTDAASTVVSMRGRSTTCEDLGDTAAYWVPTLYVDGQAIRPQLLRAYYRAVPGADVGQVQAPPAGLKMLAGNVKATAPQPVDIVSWGCGLRPRVPTALPPHDCNASSPLTLRLLFADCWDGRHVDSDDHRTHVAYSRAGRCPPSHPRAITQLQVSVEYPVLDSAGRTITLASGSPITAHGDFFNTWVQSRLAFEVRTCIHAHANCSFS